MSKVNFYDLSSDGTSLSSALVERAVNWRLTPEYVWMNDRGWEPLKVYPNRDAHVYITGDFDACRFMKVWSRKQGSEVYYLYERNGALLYEWGNGDGDEDVDRIILAEDRYIPKANELGTQLIPVGDYCILANGVNEPIRFSGKTITRKFGAKKPSAPVVYPVNPLYNSTAGTPADNQAEAFRLPSTATRLIETSSAGVTAVTKSAFGITLFDEEATNIGYGYKVAYLYADGSVGPLSDEASLDFYITTETAMQGCYVAFLNIPKGPSNVVGRVIYRTYQRGLTNGERGRRLEGGQYWHLKTVYDNTSEWVTDHYPDMLLSRLAPGYDSPGKLVVESQNFNIGCIWDGRLWISGGDYEQSVIWTAKGLLEQFEAANRATFHQGGKVTALVPYEGNLYVFRERAIDIVFAQDNGEYTFKTITTSTGTTATNTITPVPSIGLVFLAEDGFYVINGGAPTKLSKQIDKEMQRLNVSALPRATAVWNPREREYWCQFPADGQSDNTLGAVLNSNGLWSFREHLTTPTTMTITHLDYDGYNTIMGCSPYHSTTGGITTGQWRNVGLQVWSAASQAGTRLTSGASGGGGFTFTHLPANKLTSLLETKWLHLNSPSTNKTVHSVELLVKATGSFDIPMSYALDYRPVFTAVNPSKATHPDAQLTKQDSLYAEATKHEAVWDTSIFNEPRSIVIRYDIDTYSCKTIKLRIESNELLAIEGISIDGVPLAVKNSRGP